MNLRDYFQLFWIPAIASAALIGVLWSRDGLSERALVCVAIWFSLALLAQYFATIATITWVAGFTLQSALAVYLLLKQRLDA